jgi:hypothetical protein
VFAGVADYESGDLDTPNGRWLDPTQELGGIALTEHTAKIMVRYNSGGIH